MLCPTRLYVFAKTSVRLRRFIIVDLRILKVFGRKISNTSGLLCEPIHGFKWVQRVAF